VVRPPVLRAINQPPPRRRFVFGSQSEVSGICRGQVKTVLPNLLLFNKLDESRRTTVADILHSQPGQLSHSTVYFK
jgi:hypothetical protein